MAVVTQTIQDQVTELYLGFFGRAPDAAGFGYWTQEIAAGAKTPTQIANAFANTPEFISTYGGKTPVQQVTTIYNNVLNRAPDAAGLAYWVNELNSGTSIGTVVWQVVNAAFQQVGTADGLLVQNKVTVGEYFAISVGSNDLAQARSAYNLVTSAASSVAQAESTLYNTAYTLTTSVDTVTFNGSYNAINGTGTTFTAGDSITGSSYGTGNTLNVNDATGASAAGVPAGVTVSGVQTANIKSAGTVGSNGHAAGTPTAGSGQVDTITITPDSSPVSTTVSVVVNGQTYSVASVTSSASNIQAAIASALASAFGPSGTAGGVTINTSTAGKVIVTANTPGAVLPSISVSITGNSTAANASNVVTPAVETTAVNAAPQVQTITLNPSNGTYVSTDVYTLHLNGTSTAVYTGDISSGSNKSTAATQIAAQINALYGETIATANAVPGQVLITAAPGVVLPTIDVTAATASGTALANNVTNALVSAAATAVSPATTGAVYDVSGWTGLTNFNGTSVGGANLKAATTVAVNETNTGGGLVSITNAAAVNVTTNDSVDIVNATGAVALTVKAAPVTAGANGAAGVTVAGGTTVSVTEAAAVLNTAGTGVSSSGNATAITIGSAPSAVAGATASGYPQVIAGIANDPTGNVTTNVSTSFTNTSGLKDVYFGTGVATVYTNGATTVSLTGLGGALTVTDVQTTKLSASAGATAVAGTSTLTTVNLAGYSGSTNGTITSDAINTVSVTDSTYTGTLTLAGSSSTKNSGPLNVTLGNNGAFTLAAANATSVAITTVPSAYGAIAGTAVSATNAGQIALTTAKATSLSVAGTAGLTLNTSTLTQLATITNSVSAGTVALGDLSGLAYLTTIDSSAAAGKMTVTIGATPATFSQTVLGGSGADTVSLKGAIGPSIASGTTTVVNTTISLGAGNDRVAYLSGGSVAAGAVVDGGTGVDTIDALLVNGGNGATFKNFEILGLNDYGSTSTAKNLDASILSNSAITGVSFSAAIGSNSSNYTTISNIAGNALTVTNTYANGNAGYLAATLANSSGVADTATVTYGALLQNGSTTNTISGFKTSGIETINIAAAGTYASAVDAATVLDALTLLTDTSNTTQTIAITGTSAFKLGVYTDTTTFTDGFAQNKADTTSTSNVEAALSLIDASAATGPVTIVAGTAASTGSSVSILFDGLVINGGSGNDTLVNSADDGVVNSGAGNDTVIVRGLDATVSAGAGTDTIIGTNNNAQSLVTINGGVGADTLTAQQTYVIAATAASGSTTQSYTLFSDAASGDILKFATVANSSGSLGAATSVASATTLDQAMYIAGGNSTTNVTTGTVKWFQFGGNTYIDYVQKVTNETVDGDYTDSNPYVGSGSSGNTTANDILIKLTGLVDLSGATVVTSTNGTVTLA